ncbi:hypothetical protein [Fusibacter tunisiensis]|uniref:Uncharacterized protein n=1 Tax=Fusibacter tunisiensis TaxID=1008308 RepID=A0ABS2MRM4_9FIRM|nr:hypothetical protein [Fusibacter tunisiensis]MBM7562038.1 hypothetical protein [Fusibacter tunisiensis]
MSHKFSVVLVAYKEITPEVESVIKARSIRTIDEPSDLLNIGSYGRQFDQNSRFGVYLKWYQESIAKYLGLGYKIEVLEIPYSSTQSTLEVLNEIDARLGDQVLVIEHDAF